MAWRRWRVVVSVRGGSDIVFVPLLFVAGISVGLLFRSRVLACRKGVVPCKKYHSVTNGRVFRVFPGVYV